MKVLSIGTDRKLFDAGSAVLLRSMEYALKMQELHIVVFSLKKHKLENKRINNLYIYPTNSSSKLSYIFDAIKIGKEIIKKNEFSINSSVITCQDPFETGLVGVFIKRHFHFPLQIQIHTDFLSPYFRNNFLNKLRVFISKFTMPKADGIRVVSSIISESLNNSFKNLKARVDILPIFVDIEKFEKTSVVGEIMSPYTILMVSRLAKEKNITLAIDSFKKISDDFPNEGLYVVGDGEEKESLVSYIKQSGLENKIKIVGWENQDVVRSLYKSAKIFLLTSDFEGYGMTLIEAGASGVPIITTNVGVAKTTLFKDGVNSYVCPVGGVDCLSEKLIDLITNEEKRKSFANNMHDNIKDISLGKEEYVTKYVDLLKKILKS